MKVARSMFTNDILRIFSDGTLLISYHVRSRTFGHVKGNYFEVVRDVELTVPEEIVAECLAYSITGKLKGEI